MIKIPAASEVAFNAPLLTVRTTFRLLPYLRKAAALKKYGAVSFVGTPNVSASSFSLVMVLISSTGPQVPITTVAPIDVETAGMTFVRSISRTATPGET